MQQNTTCSCTIMATHPYPIDAALPASNEATIPRHGPVIDPVNTARTEAITLCPRTPAVSRKWCRSSGILRRRFRVTRCSGLSVSRHYGAQRPARVTPSFFAASVHLSTWLATHTSSPANANSHSVTICSRVDDSC